MDGIPWPEIPPGFGVHGSAANLQEAMRFEDDVLIFQCVDRFQALLRSLPGSQTGNCHPHGESLPFKWVSESTSNCQQIKPSAHLGI